MTVSEGGVRACVSASRGGSSDCEGRKGSGRSAVSVVVGRAGMRRIILGSAVVVGVVCMEGGDGDVDLDSCTGGVDAFSPRDIFVMCLTASSIQSPISFSPLTPISRDDCAPNASSIVAVSICCEAAVLSFDVAGVPPAAATGLPLPFFAPP